MATPLARESASNPNKTAGLTLFLSVESRDTDIRLHDWPAGRHLNAGTKTLSPNRFNTSRILLGGTRKTQLSLLEDIVASRTVAFACDVGRVRRVQVCGEEAGGWRYLGR